MRGPVVSVVVADHQQAFAEGLGIILDAQDDLSVLGVAYDTRRAVQLVGIRRPRPIIGTSTIRSPGSLTPPACRP
jgi:DNA-binding NarL/FixJ family response regulator